MAHFYALFRRQQQISNSFLPNGRYDGKQAHFSARILGTYDNRKIILWLRKLRTSDRLMIELMIILRQIVRFFCNLAPGWHWMTLRLKPRSKMNLLFWHRRREKLTGTRIISANEDITRLHLPEIHVDVGPLSTASEDAVEFKRRVLEDIDVRVRATLGSDEVLVTGMYLDKWQHHHHHPHQLQHENHTNGQHNTPRLAVHWFHAPGWQLNNEVSSSAVNGPPTWNRLPPALRSPDLSESAFKRAQNKLLSQRPRDASCLYCFNTKRRAQSFIISCFGFR